MEHKMEPVQAPTQEVKKVDITNDEIKVLVTGLDSSVRVICNQLLQSQNSLDALPTAINRMIEIHNQYNKFGKLYNEGKKEDPNTETEEETEAADKVMNKVSKLDPKKRNGK